jgi:hypothetical protein
MGIVQTIGNALIPTKATVKTAAAWDQEIATLQQKRDAAALRVTNNTAARDLVALDAASGNADAQAELDRTSADAYGLQLATDNLGRAIATATRFRNEATAREAAAARDAMVARHTKTLRDRVEAARDLDVALGNVKHHLNRLLDATRRADGSFSAALVGERHGDQASIGRPLSAEAVADALVRRIHALGFAAILGIDAGDLARRVDDLADEIRTQNQRVELTAAGRARVLHPEPPTAA